MKDKLHAANQILLEIATAILHKCNGNVNKLNFEQIAELGSIYKYFKQNYPKVPNFKPNSIVENTSTGKRYIVAFCIYTRIELINANEPNLVDHVYNYKLISE